MKVVKCSIWDMICVGNLILRSMVVEDLKKAYYLKSYSWFSIIFSILYHGPERIWKKAFFHSLGFCIGTTSILMTPRKFYTGYKTRKNNFSPKFCIKFEVFRYIIWVPIDCSRQDYYETIAFCLTKIKYSRFGF